MKRVIFLLSLMAFAFVSNAQQTAAGRDSLANDPHFQQMVKYSSLKAANDLMADPLQPKHVINYAQLIATAPNSSEWLTVLSYGCITNPAIDSNSTQADIQFTVNSIFPKYAAAYYRIIPDSAQTRAALFIKPEILASRRKQW